MIKRKENEIEDNVSSSYPYNYISSQAVMVEEGYYDSNANRNQAKQSNNNIKLALFIHLCLLDVSSEKTTT